MNREVSRRETKTTEITTFTFTNVELKALLIREIRQLSLFGDASATLHALNLRVTQLSCRFAVPNRVLVVYRMRR